MGRRNLELTLISAKDLKKSNWLSRMEVYAIVSLSTDPCTKQRTPADREGGRNPTWNSPVQFSIPDDPELAGRDFLHIVLRATRFIRDRPIGDVRVPIRELLAGDTECPLREQYISYQVRRPYSGKPKGVLSFSYKLGERIAQAGQAAAGQLPAGQAPEGQTHHPASACPSSVLVPYPYMPPQAHDMESKVSGSDVPVMAYPMGASSAGAMVPYPVYPLAPGAYPGYQHPAPYGYGPPPHQVYAYHPAVGYGYGPAMAMQLSPPQQQHRKSRFGMGIGAGLLGGAIGGLLIGEMASDAAAYGGGYKAGYDDGAFDF